MNSQPNILRGEVASLRLFDSGWGIVDVHAGSDNRISKVVGHPLGVRPGDTIEAEGRWVDHPTHGRQFKAKKIRTVIPSDAAGAIAWIASRLPNLGRKRAALLVERHGLPECWAVLADPARLAELPGVTPERAKAVARAFEAQEHSRAMTVELKGWGLTDGQISKVTQKWGARAIEVLRAEPFRLIDEVEQFGFVRADAVAQRMGLPNTHPARMDAAILHVLDEVEQQGHCYAPSEPLLRKAAGLLGVRFNTVGPRLAEVCDGERAGRVAHRIYRAPRMAAEEAVAAKVRAHVALWDREEAAA